MKDCNNCKYKECWEFAEPCDSCTYMEGEPKHWEAQTNADKLRSCSDEKLAWAYAYRLASCYGCEASTMEDCAKCTLKWLREDAEE